MGGNEEDTEEDGKKGKEREESGEKGRKGGASKRMKVKEREGRLRNYKGGRESQQE